MVIEVKQFDQYVIRVDGSGRITLRNRKFLRKYDPVQRRHPPKTITEDFLKLVPPLNTESTSIPPPPPIPTSNPPQATPPGPPISDTPSDDHLSINHDQSENPNAAAHPSSTTEISQPTATTPPKLPLALRRLRDHNKKDLLE